MRYALLTAIMLSMLSPLCACAQDDQGFLTKITSFPSRLFKKVDDKTRDLDRQLDRQTEKYLNNLAKKEEKLKKKLYKQDSSKAAALFAHDPQQQYSSLIQKLKGDTSRIFHSMGPEYLPYADSLQGALAFLTKNPNVLGTTKVLPANIQNSLGQFQQLQSKLQNADMIKQYIQQRRDQIRQYLSGEATIPPGASGIYNDYNKQLYYYSVQIRQYREALDDPDKFVAKALQILDKMPAFADFMKKNSFLAGLFSVPAGYGDADALTGLQTRDQVLAMIQNQIGSGGPNAASALSSSLQSASDDIHKLQDKLGAMGGGSGDIDMPNFKPQQTKTKTFLQRLEYGTNLTTTHAAYFFPTTTDLGMSVGYKLSDKSTIGIGASYKVGWGSDIQHIGLSAQGAGLRSFVDMQAKKSFYLTGGFEYNYLPLIGVTLGTLSSWQQSGLLGVTKIVDMKTKIFKKTKISLLWDFLSYQQVPRTQPIIFRVGYSF